MLCFLLGLWGLGFFGWLVFGLGWSFKAIAHLKIWTHLSSVTRTIKTQYFLLSSALVHDIPALPSHTWQLALQLHSRLTFHKSVEDSVLQLYISQCCQDS